MQYFSLHLPLAGRAPVMIGKRFRLKLVLLMLVTGLLTACAGAPVQEMSDARQAIQAARQAGAEHYSPDVLAQAQALIEKAQQQLELGEFGRARDSALSAKRKAQAARQEALEHQPPGKP